MVFFQNFRKLEHQVRSFYFSSKENERDHLKFIPFADNSINTRELDSVKKVLRKTSIKKIFRIYDNEKYIKKDWKAEINWFGKYEN